MPKQPLLDRFLSFAAKAHASRQLSRFKRAVQNAQREQDRVLRSLIARNGRSDFGREHGFRQIRTYADFARQIPVQSYENLRPYIERVMRGETSALFGPRSRVHMFAVTSGTTDKPKYIPVTDAFLSEYRRGWNVFGLAALLDHPTAILRPILQVTSSMDDHRTEAGIPCGAISGLLAATQKRLVRKYYVTPPVTAKIADPESRYYTIMRLALTRDVGWMITASPATQLQLAKTAAMHAERLIRDIRDGTLTPPGDISADVRASLGARLAADAATAKRLHGLAERYGEFLPKHYWKISLLSNWTGGTMGLHLREFSHYFGESPVRDIGLLATEGRVSIPMEDGTPAGVLDVCGAFFEFAETDDATGKSADDVGAGEEAVDPASVRRCHELVTGRTYRIIMTNAAGLYRYDLGDHVRVHGFMGQAPIIEFLHRGSHTCSMTGEKLTEWQVLRAFETACDGGAHVTPLFVLAPVWDDPPRYRLYLEGPSPAAEEFARRFDLAIGDLNVEYASKRSSGRLGCVDPILLPPVALAHMNEERRRGRGSSNEQFKHRYLLGKPGDDAALWAVCRLHLSRPAPLQSRF